MSASARLSRDSPNSSNTAMGRAFITAQPMTENGTSGSDSSAALLPYATGLPSAPTAEKRDSARTLSDA